MNNKFKQTIFECIFIGIISVICCIFSYKIIYTDKELERHKKINKNIYMNSIIISFIFGVIVHYIIKSNNLDNIYCKKICYNDKCFLVCNKI